MGKSSMRASGNAGNEPPYSPDSHPAVRVALLGCLLILVLTGRIPPAVAVPLMMAAGDVHIVEALRNLVAILGKPK